MLALPVLLDLAQRCAPDVAPETLLSVAQAESGGEPLSIGVNGPRRQALRPATPAAATRLAAGLIARGADVDLGLGQINSRNLRPLGLSVAAAFDPCRNLAASAAVLRAAYRQSAAQLGEGQPALQAALSRYNTGGPARGFRNGYVTRVLRTAGYVVPALAPSPEASAAGASPSLRSSSSLPAPPSVPPAASAAPTPTPAWDVFARPAAPAVLVF